MLCFLSACFLRFGLCARAGLLLVALCLLLPKPVLAQTDPGRWAIEVTYSGTVNATVDQGSARYQVNDDDFSAPGSYDLSMLNARNAFYSGGLTTSLYTSLTSGDARADGTDHSSLDMSGQIHIKLTWQPKPGFTIDTDPPPSSVLLVLRRTVYSDVIGMESYLNQADGVITSVASAYLDNLSSAADLDGIHPGPLKSEPFFSRILSTQGGVAMTQCSISATMSQSLDFHSTRGSATLEAGGKGLYAVDIALEGVNLGRFGSPEQALSGRHQSGASDPTFTRWLPLAFSPQISSQPFRVQGGGLPAPWGYINCMYSLALQQEGDTPNYDLDGQSLILFSNPDTGNFTPLAGSLIPKYSLLDAAGNRLVWDQNWQRYDNVHATVAFQGGGIYQLQQAGPPEDLKSKGHFTYTFQQTSQAGAPLRTRLISIADEAGNVQHLYWGTDPFLTVTDSSSGRSLLFHADTSSGYLAAVDAPELDGTIHTHTVTSFNGDGHLTDIDVRSGDNATRYNLDHFEYGGGTGDAITFQGQRNTFAAFEYVSDSCGIDPFNTSVPRLSSATYGSANDFCSSDDGGSIAGTYHYTYGPLQAGYFNAGAGEPEGRTNTFTDALDNATTTLYTLANGVYGPIVSTITTGPTFTGATAPNKTEVDYSPSMAQPTQVTVKDALTLSQNTGPWVSTFDALGQLSTITDPLSHTTQFLYQNADPTLLTSVIDPTNIHASFHYGENGVAPDRLTSLTDNANQARLLIAYNGFGQPTAFTVPAAVAATHQNEIVTFGYHQTTGDLVSVTNPLGDMLIIPFHDALGDPQTIAVYPQTGDPNAPAPNPALVTTVAYDPAQNPISITDPSGVSLLTTFLNGVAQGFTIPDPTNANNTLAQLNLSYDTRGRVYQASDLAGTAVQYRYNKNSDLTQIWDGANHITSFSYGPNDEPTGVQWPDGHSASLTYDAVGRVATATDERGYKSSYTYDAADYLKQVDLTAPNGTPITGERVQMTYDAAGRLLTISDSSGSRTYAYEATLKRLHSVTTVLNGLPVSANTYSVTYAYFPDGSVQTQTLTVGGSSYVTTYAYDAAGRLKTLMDPFGNVTTWQYDHAGRATQQSTLTRSSRTLTTAYAWGVSHQPGDPSAAPAYLQHIHQAAGTAFWDYELTHSYLGQMQQQTGSGAQTSADAYGYDARGRLASETETMQAGSGAFASVSAGYGYDAANNIAPQNATWNYNASNQLTAAPPAAGLGGATNLGYDNAGNLTSANGVTLTYDGWGQLSHYGATIYTYDAAGRWVRKSGSGGAFYVYAGDTLLAELNSSGQLTRFYAWGACGLISDTTPQNLGSGGGSNLATRGGANNSVIVSTPDRFYFFDALGNTRALLNDLAQIVGQGGYSAWGSALNGYSLPTPFGYKGQFGEYKDSESGLLYCQARYYAPSLGRWLSRDPSGFGSGPNLYAYCADDPADFFDNDGAEEQPVISTIVDALRIINDLPFAPPGLDTYIDLHDAWRDWGTAEGSKKTTPQQLMRARVNAAAQTLSTAMMLYGAGKGLSSALSEVGEAEAVGRSLCGGGECFLGGTPVTLLAQSDPAFDAASAFALFPPAALPTETPFLSSSLLTAYTKPIEAVRQGDIVAARDPQTGKVEGKRVVATSQSHSNLVVAITLSDGLTHEPVETIEATRQHPLFVEGKGFVAVGGLAIGNAIVTRAGPPLIVSKIEWKRRAEGYTVYTFLVEGDHTYFVGNQNGGLWVHNGEGDCLRPEIKTICLIELLSHFLKERLAPLPRTRRHETFSSATGKQQGNGGKNALEKSGLRTQLMTSIHPLQGYSQHPPASRQG